MSSNFARSSVQLSAALTTFRYAKNMSWLPDQKRLMSVFTTVFRIALAMCAVMFASHASAQTAFTYANTTNGAIDGSTTCAAPLVRNFNVTDNFTVSDVDLGFFATHTWRGDIRLTLQSPAGTRVQLINGDTNAISGDNLNVLLDDAFAQTVNTDSPTGNHSTAAPPPFANNFSPNAALSAFNGENSTGTWRLEICDLFTGADNGTFQHTELYLTSTPSNFADLSLSKTVDDATPINGQTIAYTITVANAAASPMAANSVTVTDLLPAGVSFVSSSDPANYNNGTGIWVVGTLAPGVSSSLTINATVTATAGGTVLNTAEVTASSTPDSDSIPGNGVTTEDDYASQSFTVDGTRIAGTPPTLFCPNGSTVFDWNAVAWAAGSTNNSYPLSVFGNINFSITNPGTWFNSATYGGQSPTRQNVIHGGFGTGEFSLSQIVDMPARTSETVTTITLPAAMSQTQFRIFDIDFNSGQFADRVEVVGFLGGTQVMPVLTNGVVNYVIGNEAFGDGLSADDQSLGNIVVTFQNPVDTIVIRYGNHLAAPTNPGLQGIAIHDFTFCFPQSSLNVTKLSSILSDPVNGASNPKALPGALVEYSFAIGNPNSYPTENIMLTDIFPGDLKMCVASIGASGPVVFTDGVPASGLTYNFTSLGSTTDSLEFSNDNGATWTYTPTADADGCDANIDGFRIRPTGSLNASRNASFRARFLIL